MQIPVRWTTPEDEAFRGREAVLVSEGEIVRIPSEDGLVLCDSCGIEVGEEEPVALIEGSAYCEECAERVFGVTVGDRVAVVTADD